MKVRGFSLILALVMLALPPMAQAGAEGAGRAVFLTGGEQLVSEKGGRVLYVNPSDGTFRVVNRADGYEWRSNPANVDEDPVARNIFRTNLRSQLLIEYLDEEKKLREENSWAGAVADGNLTVQQAGEKLLCNYYFAGPKLNVPVLYELEEDGLRVSLDYAHVTEQGACRLTRVSLLPYFGAGGGGDDGFLLLPDGSGTVAQFNNKRYAQGSVTLDIYGGDAALQKEGGEKNRPCLFPGFGIVRQGKGLLAIAEKGEGEGRVTGMVAGKETYYNHAYFQFSYRHYDTVTMLDRTWAATQTIMSSGACASPDGVDVTYRFTDEGTLGGLAAIGRGYFERLGMKSKAGEDTTLYLDVYSGVEVSKQFLGFSYKALEVLTSFEQTGRMLGLLRERGVDSFRVRLNGVDGSGAYFGKIDSKLRFSGALGGLKGYRRLVEQYGDIFYPQAQLTEFTKSGNGVFSFFHSVSGVNTKTVKRYTAKLSTGLQDDTLPARYLLRPQNVIKAADGLMKDLGKQGITSLAPDSLGNQLYSSFSGETYQVNGTKDAFTAALSRLSKQTSLLLEAPNSYAAPYASDILGLPTTHSGYYLSNYSVPFLQMMLSPYVSYSMPPANRMNDRDDMLLTALETRSMPCFSVMDADFHKVERTPLHTLYAASFADWEEDMVWLVGQLKDVYDRTGYSAVRDYRVIGEGVHSLTFDNGMVLIINRTDAPYGGGESPVPPKGYRLMEGEG